MGVAAQNITGMTLHAALCLNQSSKSHTSNKNRRDLTAMWEGVDYLFVDEVSMIGSRFLCQISEALSNAKGNTSPFGGINIIFAGDFAQLPPVGDDCLYSRLNMKNMAQATKNTGQQKIFGKLLWYSIQTVVMLSRIERQSGEQNQCFVELLDRLRDGRCLAEDYTLLNTRLVSNAQPDFNSSEWKHIPLIVSDNTVKDQMNNTAAMAFAKETQQTLHWYYASDRKSGNLITDHALNAKLQSLHSGKTRQRLGRIPLVLGMPVMITQNFDVDGGIVNGSTGTLKKIRFYTDPDGNRHLTSCIIHVDDVSEKPLPYLSPKEIPVLSDTVQLQFTHPYSKKKLYNTSHSSSHCSRICDDSS